MDTESKTSDRDTSQLSDPPSDLDSSDSDSPALQTEWLATTRKRRSTAGNRMKSMLANEEPDSDLELLFAEDENDQGFSDLDDDGSDVHMDSSSDDEDENNANDDNLEGEKELERQAKEKRAAQRKRKAQEAIPAKFRKKVRIDPTTRASVPAPAPRPKKKSERASWLPSPADLPTRASSRKTTRISKEQLHQQMAEREARRLKQLAQMEKKAARLEALKKPPMTQEERLAEAAVVEKRNSKSLNRWEEAEKQREEERKAKLAALNQRTLKGPVITFWSGKGQWDDIELRLLRQYVTEVEEKPKKKREKIDKSAKAKGKEKEKNNEKATSKEILKETDLDKSQGAAKTQNQSSEAAKIGEDVADKAPILINSENRATDDNAMSKADVTYELADANAEPSTADQVTASTETKQIAATDDTSTNSGLTTSKPVDEPTRDTTEATTGADLNASDTPPTVEDTTKPSGESPTTLTIVPKDEKDADVAMSQSKPSASMAIPASPSAAIVPPSHPPSGLAAPPPPPPASPLATQAGLSRPPEARPSSVLAAPVLAPPPGIDMNRSSPVDAPKSNVLAPPNTLQSAITPPSIQPVEQPRVANPSVSSASMTTVPMEVDAKPTIPVDAHLQAVQNETAPTSKSGSPRESEAPATTEPPRDLNATRNGIIYQNFDGNAIRDKTVQTQILFGRKMTKLAKPASAPICVITNNPARYRDPKTNLPFYNMHAYKEIQRLNNGDYQWSRILGAWVGNTKQAARGVPERFLNPGNGKPKASAAPGDSKVKQEEKSDETEIDTSNSASGTDVTIKTDAPQAQEQHAQPAKQVAAQ